jgi:hypothetical protein
VRTLQAFADQAGVQIESLKQKPLDRADKGEKLDFQKVGYELTFAADAFQLISFLNLIETHPRFMSVITFKLQAAKARTGARDSEKDAQPVRHEVQLEVETYVYQPHEGGKPVKLEGYDRKRDLLATEIAKRRGSLSIQSFEYRGQRGRRDPWVDPRIPKRKEAPDPIPIEEQIALVEEMSARARSVDELCALYTTTASPIEKMKAQARLQQELAVLETDVARTRASGQLTYVPADKRFKVEVAAVAEKTRKTLEAESSASGASDALLREAEAKLRHHIDRREYAEALSVFATVEPLLPSAEKDPARAQLVAELRSLASESRIVLDFERIALAVTGVVIAEGHAPVAIINGKAVEAGDLLDGGLMVHAIREDEIEFEYRGVVLARPTRQP